MAWSKNARILNQLHGFTPADKALLRRRFDEWKAERGIGPGGTALVDDPTFAKAIEGLIREHGYGLTDIGMMLGVSRERVRQWAALLGLTKAKRGGTDRVAGSTPRVWDADAMRFVNVNNSDVIRKVRTKHRRRTIDENAAKRQRIAAWVIRDLTDDLGRVPARVDLCETYGCDWRNGGYDLELRIGLTHQHRQRPKDFLRRVYSIAGHQQPRYSRYYGPERPYRR